MRLQRGRRMLTGFTAISLTDIVFLLLVFFLLSSTFVLQPGIKVDLPKTTVPEIAAERRVVITITADGTLYLNDRKVSRALFPSAIRQKLLSVGNPMVVLRADKRVSLELAVWVMDVARQAGAERFAIATQTKPPKSI